MPVYNGYRYEPLGFKDEARFIVLEPAKDSLDNRDPPVCSIVHCRRSYGLEYSAVSYAWGRPDFSENLEIICGGDSSYLRITKNVSDLLRRLRASKALKYLWIDAICLNQADEEEKAQQIPLMGRMYEEAKMVHIWLGRHDSMTPIIFDFIRKASQLSPAEKPQMAKEIVGLLKQLSSSDPQGAVYVFGDFWGSTLR